MNTKEKKSKFKFLPAEGALPLHCFSWLEVVLIDDGAQMEALFMLRHV